MRSVVFVAFPLCVVLLALAAGTLAAEVGGVALTEPGSAADVQITPADPDLMDAWNDTETPAGWGAYTARCFGFAYTPSISYVLQRIEFVAGNRTGHVTVAVLEAAPTGLPTGQILGYVQYVEYPPRRWQGADLVPSVFLAAGSTYYVRYEPVESALCGFAVSGTPVSHCWSFQGCHSWHGPMAIYPWMARFYGTAPVSVDPGSWGQVKALYR